MSYISLGGATISFVICLFRWINSQCETRATNGARKRGKCRLVIWKGCNFIWNRYSLWYTFFSWCGLPFCKSMPHVALCWHLCFSRLLINTNTDITMLIETKFVRQPSSNLWQPFWIKGILYYWYTFLRQGSWARYFLRGSFQRIPKTLLRNLRCLYNCMSVITGLSKLSQSLDWYCY